MNRFQHHLRSLLGRLGIPVDQEVERELAFHVEMRTRELMARGMDADAARRAAIARFGDIAEVGRRCRRIAKGRERGMSRYIWFEQLRQDLLFAVRQLRKTPLLTTVVVLTMAVAIAATTTVFSVGSSVLLEPLPYPHPEQLVRIQECTPEGELFSVSTPTYLDLREQNRSFAEMAAVIGLTRTYALSTGGEAERCTGVAATGSLFPVLGVEPRLGRVFSPQEEQPDVAARVTVISHGLWQRHFGANPDVLGKEMILDGEAWTVIGVLPAGFDFATSPDLWVPFDPNPEQGRGEHRLEVFGRLAEGVTLSEARADLAAIAAKLSRLYPESNGGWSMQLLSFREWLIGPRARQATVVLSVAVLLMLALACANVSNLLMVRVSARAPEVATRLALGASHGRIIRQMLCESLLPALLGGGVGLLLAYWAVVVIRSFAADALPRLDQITIDTRALVFSVAVSLLAGLLAGLAPALQSSRATATVLKHDPHRHLTTRVTRRLHDGLVVAELALALVLLISAGLLFKSYRELGRIDPGYTAEQVLTAELKLPASRYPEMSPQNARLFHEVLARVQEIPQVTASGATMVNPFSGIRPANQVAIETATDQEAFVECQFRCVTPGFFRAMDIPLLRGRPFLPSDRPPPDAMPDLVTVVSRSLAERLWPGQDPLGKRLRWNKPQGYLFTVVGVVGEIRDLKLDAEESHMVFLDHEQAPWPDMTMVIRTTGDPASITTAVSRAVSAVDPSLPPPVMGLLFDALQRQVAGPRLNTELLGIFAGMALVIATMGVYGVISYRVTRRRRELGLRMALGAECRNLVVMVLRQGLGLVALGIGLGVVGALGLARLLEHVLYKTPATHPGTYAAVVLIFGAVAALACYLPARRAARVDPVIALRTE